MNIVDLRDAVVAHLKTSLPDCLVTTDYQPVLALKGEDTAIVVQPQGLVYSLVDRASIASEHQIIVTVMRALGKERNAVGDAVLKIVEQIATALYCHKFSGCYVKDVVLSDPILSEDTLNNANVASAQLTLTIYGQERR